MQTRRRLSSSGTVAVNRPLMTWRESVPQCLFLHMPISLSCSGFILMLACGTGLGAVLYQTWDDGTKAVIASRSLSKAESHYPAHKLEFLTLKWAVVKKFHEYLYGSTFLSTLTTPPHIFPGNSQAGHSQSSLGHQLGKLQFPATLSS